MRLNMRRVSKADRRMARRLLSWAVALSKGGKVDHKLALWLVTVAASRKSGQLSARESALLKGGQ